MQRHCQIAVAAFAACFQICATPVFADDLRSEPSASTAPVANDATNADPKPESARAELNTPARPKPASALSLVAFPAAAVHAQSSFQYLPPADWAIPAADATASFRMPAETTVWKRLDEYRSHDNVQVLTLWQSRRFMFSLQSGKNGDAALQWGSKSLNRGEAKRGLFDRMFQPTDKTPSN
jgi:hypothetical protein